MKIEITTSLRFNSRSMYVLVPRMLLWSVVRRESYALPVVTVICNPRIRLLAREQPLRPLLYLLALNRTLRAGVSSRQNKDAMNLLSSRERLFGKLYSTLYDRSTALCHPSYSN